MHNHLLRIHTQPLAEPCWRSESFQSSSLQPHQLSGLVARWVQTGVLNWSLVKLLQKDEAVSVFLHSSSAYIRTADQRGKSLRCQPDKNFWQEVLFSISIILTHSI
jgi:hypothetical protein